MASPAFAVDKNWNNGGASNWDTAGNWTPANEPLAGDRVFINNGGTAQVTTAGNVSNAFTAGNTAGNSGTLAISGGGQLTTGGVSNLGLVAGSSGTATIAGAGSFWRVNNVLTIGNGGNGTVNITGGGLLSVGTSSVVAIGNAAGTTGIVTVDGAGSTFSGDYPTRNTGLRVGAAGNGTLTVSNGGTVNNFATLSLGALANGNGTMTITGAGSSVTIISSAVIGAVAPATLSILNGGVFNTGNSVVGSQTVSGLPLTTVTIDGAGSAWNAGGLTIAAASDANVSVSNGALLDSAGGSIGGSTGTGLVVIDNSTWEAANATGTAQIGVGSGGNGTLNIINGSTVNISNRLNVGAGNGGNGTMLIDNSTFTLEPQTAGVQANSTEIGRDNGIGILTIQNGSTVFLNSQILLGSRQPLGEGTLIVQDAGTTLTATGIFAVGQNGTGHFQLLGGAVVNTGSFVSAGVTAPSTNLIDNSTLNITGNNLIPVGRMSAGTASMDIQNGGVVNMTAAAFENFEIAQNAGSTSTITIGGTGGTLNVDQVIGGRTDALNGGVIVQGGNATVNFNHTNAGQDFDPRLRGFMTVNQMSTGTTILNGDGDYTGNTNVTGGILRAGVTDAFSENSNYVVTTGDLELDNLDNEIGSLSGDGDVTLGSGTLTTGSTISTIWSGDITGTGGLTKTGGTIFVLDSAQSYTGLTTVEQGSLHARVQDVIDSSSGLTVDPEAIFNMGGFDQTINGDVINNGLISFGLLNHELTINGNLSGTGTFFMETQLDAGPPPIGDHITVTGTSAGSHTLQILNIGGAPADLTLALELVETTDGVAQFAAAGGVVDVGVYAYTVQRGDELGLDPENWYLALAVDETSEAAKAVLNTAAGLSNSWFTQLDNLHRRMGHQRLAPKNHQYEAWIRGYARDIDVDSSVSGRPFDERINGVDVGADTLLSYGETSAWLGGVFAGYGWADRTFNDVGSEGKSRTPYGGVYATWFSERMKTYVDLTAKVQHFQNEFNAIDPSGNEHEGDYDNWATGASVEVGRRFMIGKEGWSVQPQVQAAHVHVFGEEYTTRRNTEVKVEDADIVQLRAGLEGGKTIKDKKGGVWYPYARVSVIDQESFGGHIKADTLDFDPGLEGASLEYGVGAIYQAGDNKQGYITVIRGSGQHVDTPWAVNAGFRFEF